MVWTSSMGDRGADGLSSFPFDDLAADPFGDLGDKAVPEGSEPVDALGDPDGNAGDVGLSVPVSVQCGG
jgi:hypothetical protein